MFAKLKEWIHRARVHPVKRHLSVIADMVSELHSRYPDVHLTIDGTVILENMTVQVVYHENLGELIRLEILDEDYNLIETCGPRGISPRLTGGSSKFQLPSDSTIHCNAFDDIYRYIHSLAYAGWVTKIRTSEILAYCDDREYLSVGDIRYNLAFLNELDFRNNAFHFKHNGTWLSIPIDKSTITIGIDELQYDLRYITLIDDTTSDDTVTILTF